jgi:hypothetical protein
MALAPLLLSRDGKPEAIYAPNPALQEMDNAIPYAYVRPLATIGPLAAQAGLPVNLEWGMADIEPLTARILSSPKGTQIVAWEHHWGESLARLLLPRLGGHPSEVPRWEDADSDSIFVIRSNESGTDSKRVAFNHEQKGLNGLPEICPHPVGT